ncbi:hydantoinase/carbamoylase family amidase [Neobacillus sp. Marseille-QA0830]
MENQVLEKLKWLAEYGKDNQNGITRLVYSDPWLQAQHGLKNWLLQEGFSVDIDAVGNLLASIKGASQPDEVVLTGSHLDSVVNGGIYDGQYGIIGGALAIIDLLKKYGPPKKTLQLAAFAEEEGSRFPYAMWGSRSMFGLAKPEDIEGIVDADGISMMDAMRELGYSAELSPKQNVTAFIELHIEQGSVLEKENKDIGVVSSIVGQQRFLVTVLGEPNHAGTTPMGYRRDAMKAASFMISRILTLADEAGDPLVATVGNFQLEPNISNVVPGKAIFTLDVRHTNESDLENITHLIKAEIGAIAKKQNVDVKIEAWFTSKPVPMSEKIITLLQESCERKKIPFKPMHSGAAHDSQVIASIIPTAMIFVPSQSGISHSPLEYTDEQALEKGIEVLAEALHQLAY